MPARTRGDAPLTELVERARSLATQSRARRELILLLVLLAAGLFVLPSSSGRAASSCSARTRAAVPFALLTNFFVGLANGSPVFWSVALGPYVLTLLLRLFWYWSRRSAARIKCNPARPRAARNVTRVVRDRAWL